jgi:hypothetical protein
MLQSMQSLSTTPAKGSSFHRMRPVALPVPAEGGEVGVSSSGAATVGTGVGVGMWVGVAVGVLIGVGIGVLVGGMGVLVSVLLGGTEIAVGDIGVGACVKTSGVAVGPQAVAVMQIASTHASISEIALFIASSPFVAHLG